MKADIFISYRRKGAKAEAVALYYNLKAMGYHVFLDFTSLHSGKFSDEIRDAISNCTYFLLLIHPTAFNRCKDENDCFRKEIEWALENNKKIIPILVNQNDFPTNIPEHLLKIKDFNFVPCLHLQFADEMVSRLVSHYMPDLPPVQDEAAPQQAYTEPAPEAVQEDDEVLKWASIREDQWNTCAVCGSDDVEIEDREGEFQSDLEEFALCMHYIALLSICTTILGLIVHALCQIPQVNNWVMTFLRENITSVHDLLVNELIYPELRIAIALALPVLACTAACFTRNLLRGYAAMIAARDEEDYYKAQCTCNQCKAMVYTEIPTWNLAKIEAEKESDKAFKKAGCFLVAVLIYLCCIWFSEAVKLVLHPVICFLAWPVLTALVCAAFLIYAMVEYQNLKNQ